MQHATAILQYRWAMSNKDQCLPLQLRSNALQKSLFCIRVKS